MGPDLPVLLSGSCLWSTSSDRKKLTLCQWSTSLLRENSGQCGFITSCVMYKQGKPRLCYYYRCHIIICVCPWREQIQVLSNLAALPCFEQRAWARSSGKAFSSLQDSAAWYYSVKTGSFQAAPRAEVCSCVLLQQLLWATGMTLPRRVLCHAACSSATRATKVCAKYSQCLSRMKWTFLIFYSMKQQHRGNTGELLHSPAKLSSIAENLSSILPDFSVVPQ